MTTLQNTNGFKIEFNGSTTYFVSDETGTCVFYTDTLRKAKNRLSSILKDSGLI